MAKFSLSIYDENDKVIKTYQRNKCPVDLFLRFQQYSEKVTGAKINNDIEFFAELKGLILELFPAMTETDYMNNTDTAEVIKLFNDVIHKATLISAGKNA